MADASVQAATDGSLSELARSSDKALNQLLHDIVSLKGPDFLEDALGRFRVWAKNLGAFEHPNSKRSLDHRLRNGGETRDAVRDNLVQLHDSSLRAIEIASGRLPNRKQSPINIAGATLPSTTELDELLSSIQSSINLLFRLSMLIRQQRPRGRLAILDDLPRQDPFLDIRHVTDKFEKTKEFPWLAERLGKAISERRDYISYRQIHQAPLAGSSEDHVEELLNSDQKAPSSFATTFEPPVPQESVSSADFLESDTRLSTRTGVTSFLTVHSTDSGDELEVPELTRLVFNKIQLEYDEEFECPFCRTIQCVNNHSDWKKHVFMDLQPYVCTFEGCTTGLFSSRHEWFKHEMDTHRRQWYCNQCQNKVFATNAALAEHLTTTHPGITQRQLPLILESCQRPVTHFDTQSCPLCESWCPPADDGANNKDFCRHLGQHMQQLSLSALPLTIEGLEVLVDPSAIDEATAVLDRVDRINKELSDRADSSSIGTSQSYSQEPESKPKIVEERRGKASALRLTRQSTRTPHMITTYFLAPSWGFSPNGAIALGQIILDPLRPQRSVPMSKPIEAPDLVSTSQKYGFGSYASQDEESSLGVWAKFLKTAEFGNGSADSVMKSTEYSVSALETTFWAGDPPIEAIQERLPNDIRGKSVIYVINGVKIARGLRIMTSAGKTKTTASINSAMGHPGEIDGSIGASYSFDKIVESSSDIVFAYSLLKVSIDAQKRIKGVEQYRKGAML